MYSHCATGGWILGNKIDGTQAEYVRIPHADTSLYPIPAGVDEEALVMLSDILPTGFECGVLNGKVQPGSHGGDRRRGPDRARRAAHRAVLFAGADRHDRPRREPARSRAHVRRERRASISRARRPVAEIMTLTDGAGVDCAIEAVGVPATFELCQAIVAAGGTIANVGVHGVKADLHLETLWDRNITITTRLVDTVSTPMLLKTVRSGRLEPSKLITHRFRLDDIMNAYDTFGHAADTHALKVIIEAS